MRIWCVGGWRFQIKGGEIRPLDGSAAEEALARHLAIHHPGQLDAPELQRLLSRKPGESIPKQSLHVAANKLRDLLADSAPPNRNGKKLAKQLFPNATVSTQNEMRVARYGLDAEIWVDLFDARDALAFRWLPVEREDLTALGGGLRSKPFNGFDRLATEAMERLRRAAFTRADLPEHLKRFTPPFRRLKDLIPIALDRLQPDSILAIEAGADSGRTHLAAAIELAALTWDGRAVEQVRDLPAGSPPPDPVSPGTLYTVDLTRRPKESQRRRLREIREAAKAIEDPEQRPSLLVVTGEPLPESAGDFLGWTRAEPIALPPPSGQEVTEAYLIATRTLPRDVDERREEFEALAEKYARETRTKVGLRAASSAASFAVDEKRVATVEEISPPRVQSLDKLPEDLQEVALALAWFGDDPFTMADAKAAAGRPNLLRSELFRIATKVAGGSAYEIHPMLVDSTPAPEVPRRICRYLLEAGNEEAAERWPLRAVRILSARSVELESRLRLAPTLIDLARDFGFAAQLEKKLRALLRKADPGAPEAIWGEIGRARLLIHMGRIRAAEEVLRPIALESTGAPKSMQAEAHLRLAIVASQKGDRVEANEHARKARALAPRRLGGRVWRYYGWEALYTARFGKAAGEFKRALRTESKPENRADAMIGETLALLRLGRLLEAEALLDELATMADLRRITRNRIIRAEATAKFLRQGPQAGVEILDKALGKDESRASRQSADLLEARAYLHAKLGGNSLAAADRDLERGEPLLVSEDEWQKSVIYYLQGLIAEAKIRAVPSSAKELRRRAIASAERSVAAAPSNPWNRARAHALLARLELDGDRTLFAKHLRAAADAHRDLNALCPDALRETVEIGVTAAAAWSLARERRELEAIAARLTPSDVPPDLDLAGVLALLAQVAEAAAANPRPEAGDDRRVADVRTLGRLGDTLLQGGKEAVARGKPLVARLLHPRDTGRLGAGVYDFDLATGRLSAMSDMPVQGIEILKGSPSRRFVEQRLGAVLLLGTTNGDGEMQDPLHLGQWLEAFRSQAQKDGIATIESLAVEPSTLDALGLRPTNGFLALGLAELPPLQ